MDNINFQWKGLDVKDIVQQMINKQMRRLEINIIDSDGKNHSTAFLKLDADFNEVEK